MKNLNLFFLAFTCIIFLGCESDDANNLIPKPTSPVQADGYAPKLPSPISPTSVVEEELDGAKRWMIEFDDIDYAQHYKYQRFFSTVDGSFHNINELMTDEDATANADIDFLVGRVQNAAGFLSPHPQYVAHTQFKPSNMSAKALNLMANHYPEQLTDEFENSPYAATDVQPYNYAQDKYDYDYYETGDIFLFKTDRTPARYGAVRIIYSPDSMYANDRVVEVIVQTGNSSISKIRW